MQNRGRTITFTAVLAMTALVLTGFTTGRGHGGHGRHSKSGGGGCSSSHQDHDSSSSTTNGGYGSGRSGSGYDDDDDSYDRGTGSRRPAHRSTASDGDGGGGGGEQLKDAKITLVSCATKEAPYATVKVTNSNAKTARFVISVAFVDADDITVTERFERIKVPSKGTVRARLKVGSEGLVDSVDHCETDPYAAAVSG